MPFDTAFTKKLLNLFFVINSDKKSKRIKAGELLFIRHEIVANFAKTYMILSRGAVFLF